MTFTSVFLVWIVGSSFDGTGPGIYMYSLIRYGRQMMSSNVDGVELATRTTASPAFIAPTAESRAMPKI